MARRRLRFSLWVLLVGSFVIALALGTLVASRDPIINRFNYNGIQLGMSDSEVNELLKGASVDLAPLNYEDVTSDESREALLHQYLLPHTLRNWKSDRYLISVIFDKDSRVASKYFQRAPDASAIDRIADWLGV
jgi:hypothetical protein